MAEDLFKEALKIKPEHAGALLGMALIQAEDFGGSAAAIASEALKSDPHLVEAQELLARLALEDNNDTRARDEAHKALDMDPNSVQAKAILATMDWLADKKDSSWDPHDARGYETAAHFFMLNRRYPESIALYRKAIQLDPELYTARSQMAINLMRMGQDEEAKRELQTLLGQWLPGHCHQEQPAPCWIATRTSITFQTDNTILKLHKKEVGTFASVLRS